jgi:3-deoxy-D-manno-octulosonic-acid transferase
MFVLYSIVVYGYLGLIRLASLFNPKARLWVRGRRNWYTNLKKDLGNNHRTVWFHAASLGEFEQGRTVIEGFREKYPDVKILLTFFSPSGFEVRKNYEGADFIHYLPIDTPGNVGRFLELVRPVAAVFIKYEFWFNYLNGLHRRSIPVYIISAIFRDKQHFFKWYGSWFRTQLKKVSLFFVQNSDSQKRLQKINIGNVIVSGDTRFDRVAEIASRKKEFPLVRAFSEGKKVLLAGSSWPADEKILLPFLEKHKSDVRLIIAPHEISDERISSLITLFKDYQPLRYSKIKPGNEMRGQVLLIDGIGYLSSLYQYCDVAMIGGGFGKGIHNILEAVTFGKPVVFGPNYDKFAEARDLIEKRGAFSITEKTFEKTVSGLLYETGKYENAAAVCKQYIQDHTGATDTILDHLTLQ